MHAAVHTIGKVRKERRTPLIPTTKAVLKAWLTEVGGDLGEPLFPSTTGKPLGRDPIERRLARHLPAAGRNCSSLQAKSVTMHTLRHAAAMRLLLAGKDITVIAVWHEQVSTTTIYLPADMTHKQQAIDRAAPLTAKHDRYQPPDAFFAFLEHL